MPWVGAYNLPVSVNVKPIGFFFVRGVLGITISTTAPLSEEEAHHGHSVHMSSHSFRLSHIVNHPACPF